MATRKSPTTTTSPTVDRTYGQYCPIAYGLDIMGDRWTLLILRELSLGDRRFTDLRSALTGIAPNLLTERLRSLQASGLVAVAELPPPAARSVYRLTEEGRRVEPVLRAVARFGSRYLTGEPSENFTAERITYALLAPWRRRSKTTMRARLVITRGDEESETVDLVLEPSSMRIESPNGRPDVTLRTSAADLVRARQTDEGLSGQLTGNAESRRDFLDQFALQMAKPAR